MQQAQPGRGRAQQLGAAVPQQDWALGGAYSLENMVGKGVQVGGGEASKDACSLIPSPRARLL